MLKRLLLNLACHYYPRNISCESHEAYAASAEYVHLRTTIRDFFMEGEEKDSYEMLFQTLREVPEFSHVNDISLPSWNDRCLIFELEYPQDGILEKITILISLLVPYYLVYVTDNRYVLNPYRWITSPRRSIEKEQGKYQDAITMLKAIVEAHTGYTFFPVQFIDVVISDLSFQNVMPGNFTLFNAFFLDANKFSSKDEEDEIYFFDDDEDELSLPDDENM